MSKKQIIRIAAQTILVMITIFTILKFYQYGTIPYIVKWVVTIALIAINAIYNHWCGLRNGVEIYKEHKNCMRELREESYNKIVDMVVDEKKTER